MASNKPDAEPSHPTRRFTDLSGEARTVIGPRMRVKGQLQGESNLEIQGTVEGVCKLQGLFTLRPGGLMVGDVFATHAVVEGELQGNINAAEKVELRADCKVTGDIMARSVAVAEGSFFEGKINMTGAGTKSAVVFQEKRATPAGEAEKGPKEG